MQTYIITIKKEVNAKSINDARKIIKKTFQHDYTLLEIKVKKDVYEDLPDND